MIDLMKLRETLINQSDDFLKLIDNSNFGKAIDEIHKNFFDEVWEAINKAQIMEIEYSKTRIK